MGSTHNRKIALLQVPQCVPHMLLTASWPSYAARTRHVMHTPGQATGEDMQGT